MQSVFLDLIESKGGHSGADIAQFFLSTVEKFEIVRKIMGITVDNVSANTTFMENLEELLSDKEIEFNAEDQHFRCFAHIINLGVQEISKTIDVAPTDENTDDNDRGI